VRTDRRGFLAALAALPVVGGLFKQAGVDGMVPSKFYHAVSFEHPSQIRAIELYVFHADAVYVTGRTAQNAERHERWPLVREA